MKTSAAIVAIASCAFVIPALSMAQRTVREATPETETMAMLDESYSLGHSLENEADRVWYMGDLTNVAARLGTRVPSSKLQEWCLELFDISRAARSTDVNESGKLASEANALVRLSTINPQMAMERFAWLKKPALDDEKRLPEDVRANAAIIIFRNYWQAKGNTAIEEIRQQAAQIGASGEYPYRALATIIENCATDDSDDKRKPDALFREALNAYSHPSDFPAENRDQEFLSFLVSIKKEIDPDGLKEAVLILVDHLIVAKDHAPKNRDLFRSQVLTPKGIVIFNNEAEQLLFRAFSLIKEVDPFYAEQLRSKAKDLEYADDPSNVVMAGAYSNSPAKLDRAWQDGALMRIKIAREEDPRAALKMAQELQDPDVQIIGIITVLPKIAQSDGKQFEQLYSDAKKKFNGLKEDLQGQYYLKAKVAMAEAAYYAKDDHTFQNLVGQVCDQAIGLFLGAPRYRITANQEARYMNVDDRPGYQEITEIVRFGMSHDITWIKDNALRLAGKDAALRANLLLFAAEGQAEDHIKSAGGRVSRSAD